MESFLPSEIGRLIYGYLSECDENLADMFLNNSNVMEECRTSKNKSRRFSPKVQGLSLVDILDQYSILCSLIFKNVNNTDCVHRNVLSLLQNMLYSKVCERNRSLADNLLRQDAANVTVQNNLTELRQDASISEPILENIPQNVSNSTNVSTAVVEMHTSQSVVENMDVSSSSTVDESQTASKVVEQSAQTEPVELISLLESDNEMVTNNCRDKATEVYREHSPIDLTSPRPVPSIFDTPKPEVPIDRENAENSVVTKKPDPTEPPKCTTKEKAKTPALKAKARSAPKPVSLPELKPQEVQKSPNEHTPPENIKNSRIRDSSVFSNLSLNPDRRKDSYRTPLKPRLGILHINNDPSNPGEGYAQRVPFMEKVTKNQEKSVANNSVIDQNRNTAQPAKNDKVSLPLSNTSSSVKQNEPAPKPVQSTSKPPDRRESCRNPPTIIPPHRERPPGVKASSRQPRETSSKYDSKPTSSGTQPIEQASFKPPLPAEAPLISPPEGELKRPSPLVDQAGDSKLRPEPNEKIPWDWKLRQRLPDEVKTPAPKPPRKTPKKGKRELNKNLEPPTKKRKFDEPSNTTKAKRSRSKNQPEDRELNKSSEDQPITNIDKSIKEHPLAYRNDHFSDVKLPAEIHRPLMKTDQSRHEAQTMPNMQIPGDYSSRSLPKIEKTPEVQRLNHVPNRRSTPELHRRSPNLSRNESKPERRNSSINRPETKHRSNQNSLIKSTPESRASPTLPVEQPQTEHLVPPNVTLESQNFNEPPKLPIEDDKASQAPPITSYRAQPVPSSTAISEIFRLASENAAYKTNLVNLEVPVNEDTESICTDTQEQLFLSLEEEVVLYEANINVTPSC